jgi:hypothetical protein
MRSMSGLIPANMAVISTSFTSRETPSLSFLLLLLDGFRLWSAMCRHNHRGTSAIGLSLPQRQPPLRDGGTITMPPSPLMSRPDGAASLPRPRLPTLSEMSVRPNSFNISLEG